MEEKALKDKIDEFIDYVNALHPILDEIKHLKKEIDAETFEKIVRKLKKYERPT